MYPQVPIDLIKQNHNFNFPTYWQGKNYITKKNQISNQLQPEIMLPGNQLVPVPGGTVFLSKEILGPDLYGWDNEYGSETKELCAFEVSQMLVSNAEYLEFVQAGGYTTTGRKWWSDEGWRYVTDLKVTAPRFWIRDNTYYRAMLEEIPMPWNLPVEVNNLEAEAFCNWKSERLGRKVRMLTHEELIHMRLIASENSSNSNLNKYASPTPVNLYGGLIDGRKIYDISGKLKLSRLFCFSS